MHYPAQSNFAANMDPKQFFMEFQFKDVYGEDQTIKITFENEKIFDLADLISSINNLIKFRVEKLNYDFSSTITNFALNATRRKNMNTILYNPSIPVKMIVSHNMCSLIGAEVVPPMNFEIDLKPRDKPGGLGKSDFRKVFPHSLALYTNFSKHIFAGSSQSRILLMLNYEFVENEPMAFYEPKEIKYEQVTESTLSQLEFQLRILSGSLAPFKKNKNTVINLSFVKIK